MLRYHGLTDVRRRRQDPHIILSVRNTIFKSLGSSAVLFAVLAVFTYIPQAGLLSLLTGPLGPILAIFLLGAESIFLLVFFAKPLFLEPALQHVFDTTLAACGQNQLLKDGTSIKRTAALNRAGAFIRPLQALARDGVVRYLITLPLNFVPILGTVVFLFVNGRRAGPGWHVRYYQLKGYTSTQQKDFISKHRADYDGYVQVHLF